MSYRASKQQFSGVFFRMHNNNAVKRNKTKNKSGAVLAIALIVAGAVSGFLFGYFFASRKNVFEITSSGYDGAISKITVGRIIVDSTFAIERTDVQSDIDMIYGTREKFRSDYLKRYDSLFSDSSHSHNEIFRLHINRLSFDRSIISGTPTSYNLQGGMASGTSVSAPSEEIFYHIDFSVYNPQGTKILAGLQNESVNCPWNSSSKEDWNNAIKDLEINLHELLTGHISSSRIKHTQSKNN